MGVPAPPPPGPRFAEAGALFTEGPPSPGPLTLRWFPDGLFAPGQHLRRHSRPVASVHSRASSVRENFKAACRHSKSCLLISHTAFTPEALQRASRDPEGEPGSRAHADSRGARPGREREPARDTPPDGPGTGPSLWAVRGVRSHSTERDLLLAPTESLGAGG